VAFPIASRSYLIIPIWMVYLPICLYRKRGVWEARDVRQGSKAVRRFAGVSGRVRTRYADLPVYPAGFERGTPICRYVRQGSRAVRRFAGVSGSTSRYHAGVVRAGEFGVKPGALSKVALGKACFREGSAGVQFFEIGVGRGAHPREWR